MELVVAAETETSPPASDGPGPPTESPTIEGMAETGLRELQAGFARVTSHHKEVQLNLSFTQYPTLLGVWIQLKPDASNTLPKVVHTPAYPRNEAPAVLALDLE
jgi:hypothetical protein